MRRKDKYIVLPNLTIYCTWKNINTSYKNNELKISTPSWNEEFELFDGSCYITVIQGHLKCILKNHGEKQLILEQEYTQIK